MSAAASIAARVAGAVAAAGFALGFVDGPIVAVVGALALIAFGRSLATAPGTELIGPLAFAVVAGSSGVVALRWGTLDVVSIRGIQAVLGPTVAVEPLALAAACGAAGAAGVIATGVWLADDLTGSGLPHRWRMVEIVTASVALAALFAGPEPAGVIEIGIWVGATACAAILSITVGRLVGIRSARVQLGVLAAAGFVVAVAAGVVGNGA